MDKMTTNGLQMDHYAVALDGAMSLAYLSFCHSLDWTFLHTSTYHVHFISLEKQLSH